MIPDNKRKCADDSGVALVRLKKAFMDSQPLPMDSQIPSTSGGSCPPPQQILEMEMTLPTPLMATVTLAGHDIHLVTPSPLRATLVQMLLPKS